MLEAIAQAAMHGWKKVAVHDEVKTQMYKNMSIAYTKLNSILSLDNRMGLAFGEQDYPSIYLTNKTKPSLSAVSKTGKVTIPLDELLGLLVNVDCAYLIVSIFKNYNLPT